MMASLARCSILLGVVSGMGSQSLTHDVQQTAQARTGPTRFVYYSAFAPGRKMLSSFMNDGSAAARLPMNGTAELYRSLCVKSRNAATLSNPIVSGAFS